MKKIYKTTGIIDWFPWPGNYIFPTRGRIDIHTFMQRDVYEIINTNLNLPEHLTN